MQNFTPELIAKAKAAKSAEELLEVAKSNGIELTAEEANTYFEQLNTNGAVSDDELEAVSGGFICETLEGFLRFRNRFNKNSCPYCDDKSNEPTFESNVTQLPYNSSDQNKVELL